MDPIVWESLGRIYNRMVSRTTSECGKTKKGEKKTESEERTGRRTKEKEKTGRHEQGKGEEGKKKRTERREGKSPKRPGETTECEQSTPSLIQL
jgi:hypothetical protein